MYRRMKAFAEKLDKTRIFTSAVCAPPKKAPIMAELDVIGINYNLDMYDDARRLYPNKPFIATEFAATSTNNNAATIATTKPLTFLSNIINLSFYY